MNIGQQPTTNPQQQGVQVNCMHIPCCWNVDRHAKGFSAVNNVILPLAIGNVDSVCSSNVDNICDSSTIPMGKVAEEEAAAGQCKYVLNHVGEKSFLLFFFCSFLLDDHVVHGDVGLCCLGEDDGRSAGVEQAVVKGET